MKIIRHCNEERRGKGNRGIISQRGECGFAREKQSTKQVKGMHLGNSVRKEEEERGELQKNLLKGQGRFALFLCFLCVFFDGLLFFSFSFSGVACVIEL